MNIFGFPVQFFRAVQAIIMTFFVFRALRAFEVERQQRLDSAHEARLAAQRQALQTQQEAQSATDQLNRELRERETLLGQLLQKVVSAQEGERQRIARELHDGTGQILTALGLGLAAAGESLKSDPILAAGQLAELKRLNADALQELHDLIGDLRPAILDDLGLIPALKGQVREFESRTGVEAKFNVEGKRRSVRPDIETIVFRIGQEALTNVAKHADARHATVELCYDDQTLQLIVQDDGRGFDPGEALHLDGPRRAWGLLGIQERVALAGGTCSIVSQPGSGTRIEATIPRIGP
jgi:signal transduction histidine kinase